MGASDISDFYHPLKVWSKGDNFISSNGGKRRRGVVSEDTCM